MDLFNSIRDFFVRYVFGGTLTNTSDSNNYFYGIGQVNGSNVFVRSNISFVKTGLLDPNGNPIYLRFGDWLSSMATIVSMITIVILICLFIRWIFKIVSGAIILR